MSTHLFFRQIDHLVYCVPNLEEAIAWFEEQAGVRPVVSGKHPTKGTKNALVNLGSKCYLELLAADYENTSFSGNRWMGVDTIETPTMTRWSLKSEHLENDSRMLKSYNSAMGIIEGGQRQTSTREILHWKMVLPLAEPLVEVVPFITDWSGSDIHPTDNLPEFCLLKSLTFYHPQPANISPVFKGLGLTNEIILKNSTTIITKIETPAGLLILA